MIEALITGGVAGWLAGILMKGKGYGILVNIILGVAGGALGSWLLRSLGFYKENSFIANVITAILGAAILIAIVRAIRK